MDAVIMDETGRTKHTCGHDAHMTILLSLAELLMKNRNKIKGTVKLLFEPDEEGKGRSKENDRSTVY
ncbi:MAG: amidohydrolase [Clostridia bacterium]|nr:amidohydrolase [Clostridia bacterium]